MATLQKAQARQNNAERIKPTVGRRKTSVARAFLKAGDGSIVINKRPLDRYFGRKTARMIVCQPFEVTNLQKQFNVSATVSGGGISGQAGAIRLAIARALVRHEKKTLSEDQDGPIKKTLRAEGYLTRDDREVERKKVGLKGARRRPQFSKR